MAQGGDGELVGEGIVADGEQGQLRHREVVDVRREVIAGQGQNGTHPAGRIRNGVGVVQLVL